MCASGAGQAIGGGGAGGAWAAAVPPAPPAARAALPALAAARRAAFARASTQSKASKAAARPPPSDGGRSIRSESKEESWRGEVSGGVGGALAAFALPSAASRASPAVRPADRAAAMARARAGGPGERRAAGARRERSCALRREGAGRVRTGARLGVVAVVVVATIFSVLPLPLPPARPLAEGAPAAAGPSRTRRPGGRPTRPCPRRRRRCRRGRRRPKGRRPRAGRHRQEAHPHGRAIQRRPPPWRRSRAPAPPPPRLARSGVPVWRCWPARPRSRPPARGAAGAARAVSQLAWWPAAARGGGRGARAGRDGVAARQPCLRACAGAGADTRARPLVRPDWFSAGRPCSMSKNGVNKMTHVSHPIHPSLSCRSSLSARVCVCTARLSLSRTHHGGP